MNREIAENHIKRLREAMSDGQVIIISRNRAAEIIETISEALAEREPVSPSWGQGKAFCGNCGKRFALYGEKFCHNCGREVNWHG